MTLTLWIQQGNNVMRKLAKPSNKARIVKLKSGDWYILWYSNSLRYRPKYNINFIKDLSVRQIWAERIVEFVNLVLQNQGHFSEDDIPIDLIPPPEHHNKLPHDADVVKKNMSFLTFFRSQITMKEREGKSPDWIKTLNSLYNNIASFAKDESLSDYTFDIIDKKWADRYKNWCIAKPREYSANTIAKRISTIRSIIKQADIEEELKVNDGYKSKHYTFQKIETDQIALSYEELIVLKNLDLESETFQKVRDNIVVACFTGLRWGDWQIKKQNIVEVKGRKMLKVFTHKTKEMVIIPLHPIAEEILKLYDYNLPYYTNQTCNRYAKEIGALAGFDGNEVLKKSKAGKAIQVCLPRFKFISTHTARRTFITIALFDMNLPSQLVMKITGHKSERQLFKYARIGKEQAAMLFAKAMDDFYDKFITT
jgi:integrase